jgi:hypothetical protein
VTTEDPLITLYLLSKRLPKKELVGTGSLLKFDVMMKYTVLGILIMLMPHVNIHGQYSATELKKVHSIDFSGDLQLQINFADSCSFEIDTKGLGEDCFTHSIEGDILKLKVKHSGSCDEEVRAILTIPSLNTLKLTGHTEVYSSDLLKTDRLVIYQQLGSKAVLSIDVKSLDVTILEGSTLEISGYTDYQKVSAFSKAVYSAIRLSSEEADITAKMLATAKLCVEERLKATASTNAYIIYQCNPEHTELNTKLGGKIEKSTD